MGRNESNQTNKNMLKAIWFKEFDHSEGDSFEKALKSV